MGRQFLQGLLIVVALQFCGLYRVLVDLQYVQIQFDDLFGFVFRSSAAFFLQLFQKSGYFCHGFVGTDDGHLVQKEVLISGESYRSGMVDGTDPDVGVAGGQFAAGMTEILLCLMVRSHSQNISVCLHDHEN